MTLRAITQAAGVYWQKRFVRIVVAILVLTGAVFFQYRLAQFFPLPVEVEKGAPQYSPATAGVIRREELVVDSPTWQTPGAATVDSSLLFTYEGREYVQVEAYFEAAHLHDDIIQLLQDDRDLKQLPPPGLQPISYTTADDESIAPPGNQAPPQNDVPCRTSIHLTSAAPAKLPTQLHFFPMEGSDRRLLFEMTAEGTDLMVEIVTRNSAANSEGKIQGPGCTKSLSVGDWKHPPFASPVALHIVVPAGKRLQFSFLTSAGKAPWSADIGYEPFRLELAPLTARAVRKVKQGTSSGSPLFEASSIQGVEPLLLKHLWIRSGEAQLNFSGKAMVRENGKYVATFDPWEFAKKNPLLLAVLTILNAGLLEWIRRVVFGSKRKVKQARTQSRRRKKRRASGNAAP